MIVVFPDSAYQQLEFDKVKAMVANYCASAYGRERVARLEVLNDLSLITTELGRTYEYQLILKAGQYFPQPEFISVQKEIKLLSIPGAVLSGEQFIALRKLTENMQDVFRWFTNERREAYPHLCGVIADTFFEKVIKEMIDEVVDDTGYVKDDASEELSAIRMRLYRRRAELRKMFSRILSKLQKTGYVADIEESFLNGRKVVALFAEHKRQVKGILHGQSDTGKTVYMEPEETIELNNEIFSLENEERNEVYRVLRLLTSRLSVYAPLLSNYHDRLGEYDFIRAKTKLAIEMNATLPQITHRAQVVVKQAYHPLLYLYNLRSGKPTIPIDLSLHNDQRILIISGPNAGGKTVTLKTVGLLQLMLQAGFLVPVHPDSEFGIFNNLFIHIGDTQSLEFELSTYSSHLKNMKYFTEAANGRTLFFIDELGSGSDPTLGGAFAEAILEELNHKHAIGIVTTHYLNLKVMANKVKGIINGAMAFDETKLLPLYRLLVGKPGSSYTFSIAERIGLNKKLIDKARALVPEEHVRLDQLLNSAERTARDWSAKRKQLDQLLKENEQLKKEMSQTLNREKHRQQIELLKLQNRNTEERLAYLKDLERKLKAIVAEWKRTENKEELIRLMQALLFKEHKDQREEKIRKKLDSQFEETGEDVKEGDKVLMKNSRQVGIVQSLRGKNAVVRIGALPITIAIKELKVVKEKTLPEG